MKKTFNLIVLSLPLIVSCAGIVHESETMKSLNTDGYYVSKGMDDDGSRVYLKFYYGSGDDEGKKRVKICGPNKVKPDFSSSSCTDTWFIIPSNKNAIQFRETKGAVSYSVRYNLDAYEYRKNLVVSHATNSQSNESSYSCYAEFRNIGENRLDENKSNTSKLIKIIENIQKNRGVGFNAALEIFKKFEGNSETISIDNKIAEIDKKSSQLNSLITKKSGEVECKERMLLEAERRELSALKFEALNREFSK